MGIDPLIQPSLCTGTQKKARSGEWYYVLFLSLLGLYANAVVYGFQYPAGADYNFFCLWPTGSAIPRCIRATPFEMLSHTSRLSTGPLW